MKRRYVASLSFALMVVVLGAARSVNATSAQETQKRGEPNGAAAGGGWLGIALSCSGCEGQGTTGPLIVRAIVSGGPAGRILQPGDTIVSVNRTIREARKMREVLASVPRDSIIEFEMGGVRGHYTVKLRKQRDRLSKVGADSLPLKYRGSFNNIGVEVLTGEAPVISRDSTGAMTIRVGAHAVRLLPSALSVR